MRAIVMSIRVVFAADNANETTTAVIGDFAVSLSKSSSSHSPLFSRFSPKVLRNFFFDESNNLQNRRTTSFFLRNETDRFHAECSTFNLRADTRKLLQLVKSGSGRSDR